MGVTNPAPSSRLEAFSLIERSEPQDLFQEQWFDEKPIEKWLTTQLTNYAQTYPFMKGVKPKDYLRWKTKKLNAHQGKKIHWHELSKSKYLQNFYNAAYEYDPEPRSIHKTSLASLMGSSQDAKPIILGKLYGSIPLWLVPDLDSLPPSDSAPRRSTYPDYIYYPDAHPPETYSKGSSEYLKSISPQEDTTLRRIQPLGWIATDDHRTGHVLVIDMDRGRDHHPWVVLAKEWEHNVVIDYALREEIESISGYRIAYDDRREAPDRVARYDATGVYDDTVNGVFHKDLFNGDRTRTTIAKVCHLGPSEWCDTSTPMLKQFGPDFSFSFELPVSQRPTKLTAQYIDYHPDMAHVMGCTFDLHTGEDVCYAENGVEYMRYHHDNGTYKYLCLDDVPIVGKIGVLGEIVREGEEMETVTERWGGLSLGQVVDRHSWNRAEIFDG